MRPSATTHATQIGSVGSNKQVTIEITIKSYPTMPKQNNIFFHDGKCRLMYLTQAQMSTIHE